jgi:hypothetical protein
MHKGPYFTAREEANKHLFDGHSVGHSYLLRWSFPGREILHHELKDGLPLMMWFFVYSGKHGFIEFDIRDVLKLRGLELPSNWENRCSKLSSVSRLLARCHKGFDGAFIDMIIEACGPDSKRGNSFNA